MVVGITNHFLIGLEASVPQEGFDFQYWKPDQKLMTGAMIRPNGKSTGVSLSGHIVQYDFFINKFDYTPIFVPL